MHHAPSFVLSYFTIEETGFLTLHSYEECLGSTKLEEHIQTDRNMILIIGYIEIYDSLILAILILHIGKAQATVLHTIICLDGNPPSNLSELECGSFHQQ